jgi:hypothetical protein
VVWISLLQGAILGGVALLGGILLANSITHAIGRARSFLISARRAARVVYPAVLGYGLLGIALILLLLLLLPPERRHNTIVSYKQERARMQHQPWWQKYWLDLFLLIPRPTACGCCNQSISRMEDTPDPLEIRFCCWFRPWAFSRYLFTLRLVRLMETLSLLLRRQKRWHVDGCPHPARTPAFTAPRSFAGADLGLGFYASWPGLSTANCKQVYYNLGADVNILEIGTTSAGGRLQITPSRQLNTLAHPRR